MLGNKRKVLRIEMDSDVMEPTFTKEKDCILYIVPTSIGVIDNSANNRLKNGS